MVVADVTPGEAEIPRANAIRLQSFLWRPSVAVA